MECKDLAKDLAGDKWTLVDLKALSKERFWNWAKSGGIDNNEGAYL